MSEIIDLNLVDLVQKIKEKKLSSKEITKAYVDRAEISKKLNTYITDNFEKAIKNAEIFDDKPDFEKIMKNNFKINKIKYDKKKLDQNKKEIHKISNKIFIHNKEANMFMQESNGFDYIDVDPFGTPNPFLDNAVRRISRNGILAITATDTSALAGTYPKACKRKYFALPLRNHLMHELGLRILIRKIQLIGGQYDKALIPVFSYSKDHYYRIFLRCEKGKSKVDEMLNKHKYFLYCNKCMNFFVDRYNNHDCDKCNKDKSKKKKIKDSNKQMVYAGPLWTGKLFDTKLVKKMKKENYVKVIGEDNKIDSKENIKFFEMLCEEALVNVNNVGFFDIPAIMKKYKIGDSIKFNNLISRLKKKKHKVIRTHFGKQALKSDCGVGDVVRVMKVE